MYAKLISKNSIVEAPNIFKDECVIIVNFNQNIEAMANHGYYPVKPDAAPPEGYEIDWDNCTFKAETSVETRIGKAVHWTTDEDGNRLMVSESVEYEQSVGVIHAVWAYKEKTVALPTTCSKWELREVLRALNPALLDAGYRALSDMGLLIDYASVNELDLNHPYVQKLIENFGLSNAQIVAIQQKVLELRQKEVQV